MDLPSEKQYFSDLLYKQIEKLHGHLTPFTLKCKDKLIANINIAGFNEQCIEYISNIIAAMYTFASKFTKIDYSVRLQIYNIPEQKIYKLNQAITRDNVNSGYCYFNKKPREIYLYRNDELGFIMTHELVHAYNLDTLLFPEYAEVNKFIKNKFGIHNPVSFEAVTDIIALYVWTHYVADANNCNYKSLMQKQIEFVNNQALFVIKALNGEFSKQNTHIFEYYVLRAIIVNNFLTAETTADDFTKDCFKAENIISWIKRDYDNMQKKAESVILKNNRTLRRNFLH